MSLTVITPPSSFMTPADVPGGHAANDAFVQACIDAAVGEIDGPKGWLGRSLGVQVLELAMEHFPRGCQEIALPCGPVISITSVKYLDINGVDQTLAGSAYEMKAFEDLLLPVWGTIWPSVRCWPQSVRIRYQAGFNNTAVASNGTGPLPKTIKQAIVLMTKQLMNVGSENIFLSEKTQPGLGTRRYTVTPAASALLRESAQNLLWNERRYR